MGLRDGRAPRPLSAKLARPARPAASPALDDGKALLVAGDGGDSGDALSRVDLTTCKRAWSIDGASGAAPAVSPDGKTVLVAPGSGAIQLHGLADGALLRSFQPSLPAPSVPARRKGKHDDDDDDDGGDGDRRGTYTTAVGFLADKDQAMSADSAGGITVWNLTTGKAIGHNATRGDANRSGR